MPKKKKEGKQTDQADGRPAGLTLGSFITSKLDAAVAAGPSAPQVPENEESVPTDLPQAQAAVKPEVELAEDMAPKYHVRRTKKGNLPISYENRNKGKKVTVLANVSGDASSLLSELKHRAGCGGVIKGETIELQGDRRDLLNKYLKGHPCIK